MSYNLVSANLTISDICFLKHHFPSSSRFCRDLLRTVKEVWSFPSCLLFIYLLICLLFCFLLYGVLEVFFWFRLVLDVYIFLGVFLNKNVFIWRELKDKGRSYIHLGKESISFVILEILVIGYFPIKWITSSP